MELSIGIYTVLVVLLFLIIPGFIARRFYFNGELSKQFNWSLGNISSLVSSFFLGIILSIIFVKLLDYLRGTKINIEEILNTFDEHFVKEKGDNKGRKFDGMSILLYHTYIPYLFLFYSFSATCGFLFSRTICYLGIDIKYKLFRFHNVWYYLFNGKLLRFKINRQDLDGKKTLKVKYVYLDVLVSERGDKTSLYSGLYLDYELSHKEINKLEKLHLLKAKRYKINRLGKAEPVIIPGSIFTILGNNILNINTTYIFQDINEVDFIKFIFWNRVIMAYNVMYIIFWFFTSIILIFSINILHTDWLVRLLTQSFWLKIVILFGLILIFNIIIPFEADRKTKKIQIRRIKEILLQIVTLALYSLIIFYFYK